MKILMSKFDIQRSIHFFCKVLHDFYKSKVIILIDEFDRPYNDSFSAGNDALEYLKTLMSEFLGIIENENYL